MLRTRLWLAAAWLVLLLASGCPQRLDGGVILTLNAAPALKADCLKVSVLVEGREVRFVTLDRPAGRSTWTVGLSRTDDLPATVQLVGEGFIGACSSPTRKLNARTAPLTLTFPESEVTTLSLTLSPPDPTLDVDRDGYVGTSAGGVDCDDAEASVSPAATQVCTSAVDTDCNGTSGCQDPACAGDAACANPANRLAFARLAATATRYACVTFDIETRNDLGVRPVNQAVMVALSASKLELYTTADCSGAPASQATIPPGASLITLSVRPTGVGQGSVTASAVGFTPANQAVSIQGLPPASVTFSTPATLPAGQCSEPIAITVLDAQGRPAEGTLAQSVTLAGSPLGATDGFFTTGDCSGTPITSVVILPEQASTTVRFRSTIAGPADVSATVASVSTPRTITVEARAATRLGFTNNPLSLRTADACSSVRNAVLRLEVQDTYGNATVAPSNLVVNLAVAGLAGVTFFDQAQGAPCSTAVPSVTIPQGAGTAAILLRASATGTGIISATPTLGTISAATQRLDVAAGDPTTLMFLGSMQSPAAGQCSGAPLTLEMRDASGVPSSFATDRAITVGTSPPSTDPQFAFFTRPGCPDAFKLTGGALTIPAGQSSANLYFRGRAAAGPFAITATSAPLASGSSPGHRITAGPPAELRWTAPAVTTAQAGTCSQPYTLTAYDAQGNPTSFSSTAQLTPSSAPAGATFGTSASACSLAGPFTWPAGQASLTLHARSTTVGTYQLSATTGAVSTATSTAFSVTPGTAELRVLPGAVNQAVGECAQLAFNRVDQFSNPVPATAPENLMIAAPNLWAFDTQLLCTSTSNGSGAATSFTVATGTNGRSVWIRSNTPRISTVVGTLGAASAPTVNVTIRPGPPTALTFNGLPASGTSGACAQNLTLGRRDSFGNVTDAGMTSVTLTAPGLSLWANGTCTGPQGSVVSFADGDTTSGPFSLTGVDAGTFTVSTVAPAASSTYTVGAGMPASLVFLTPAGTVPAGFCSGGLTVELRDSFNNPTSQSGWTITLAAADAGIAFFSDTGCATPASQLVTSTTQASFSFRPTVGPGPWAIDARQPGFTGTQAWTVTAGPASQLAWSPPPPATLPAFTCAGPYTVELRDLVGTPVGADAGLTLGLESTGASAGLTFYSDGTCVTPVASLAIAAGAQSASFGLGATGQGASTLVVDGGLPLAVGRSLTVDTPGSLRLTGPASLEAGACASLVVSRLLADAGVATLGGSEVLLATDSGVSLHGDSECAGATVDRVLVAGGTSNATVYVRGRSAPDENVPVVATTATGGLSSASTAILAYPLVRRGRCTLGGSASSCATIAALSTVDRSFLVFQATGVSVTANRSAVRCLLAPPNQIVCDRNTSGNDVQVAYQLVSYGRPAAAGGASVIHLDGGTSAASGVFQETTTVPAVDPSTTFSLFSHHTTEPLFANQHFLAQQLVTGTSVHFTTGGADLLASAWGLQLVTLAGARVFRGSSAADGGVWALPVGLSSPDVARLSPLHSVAVGGGNEPCSGRFSARLDGGAWVFTRGDGALGWCIANDVRQLAYETIEWPAGTTVEVAAPILMGPDTLSASWTLGTPRPPHRTVVYLPGQGPSGQASGEITGDGGTGPLLFSATALLEMGSSTSVTLTRGSVDGGTALFIPYAVTLEP